MSIAGFGVLIFAAALAVTMPPNAVTVISAAMATILLATDRRLGPLPAAALVALALPWGRGADTLTFEFAGLPVRPHDAALIVGIVAALPRLRRRWPPLTASLVFAALLLALGVGALLTGVARGNDARDVVRDVRWWGLYGVIVLAAFGATTRPAILRGMMIGLTMLAVVVILAALLPLFDGGLKDQELTYDRGALRMQFGNSAYLLVSVAYVTAQLLRRRTWWRAGWLVLLLSAVVLSLTRTSILATGAVVGLCLIAYAVQARGRATPRHLLRSTGALALVGVAALAVGLVANIAGTPAQSAQDPSGGPAAPIDRLLFRDPESDLGSLAIGRFPSYRAAAAVIIHDPITGAGLGSLTDVDYAYNAARAHTLRRAPSVDNAYLTVGLKTGVPGIVILAGLMVATLLAALRRLGPAAAWFAPAWVGLAVLTMTQAFAVSLYGPFPLALLVAYPILQRGSLSQRRGTPQIQARVGA